MLRADAAHGYITKTEIIRSGNSDPPCAFIKSYLSLKNLALIRHALKSDFNFKVTLGNVTKVMHWWVHETFFVLPLQVEQLITNRIYCFRLN